MAGAAFAPTKTRHPALVRITHWITAMCFLVLLVTGLEIVVSHPRFYWGNTGASNTPALFRIHIPSSRATVPTGYRYVLPDQNGWSRYLHFEAAWLAVLTGALYTAWGLLAGHFRRSLLPPSLLPKALSNALRNHLLWKRRAPGGALAYNPIQQLTYLTVIFVLFPLMIWTGLAMSPAVESAAPWIVTLLGGRQTARTLHFFITIALLLFFIAHVGMVWFSGFRNRMTGMITGRIQQSKEETS